MSAGNEFFRLLDIIGQKLTLMDAALGRGTALNDSGDFAEAQRYNSAAHAVLGTLGRDAKALEDWGTAHVCGPDVPANPDPGPPPPPAGGNDWSPLKQFQTKSLAGYEGVVYYLAVESDCDVTVTCGSGGVQCIAGLEGGPATSFGTVTDPPIFLRAGQRFWWRFTGAAQQEMRPQARPHR